MPLTELNHFLLVAKDLERTRNFYQKVLGLDLADRPDFGFPGYWLRTGDNICVHLASQDPNEIRDQFLLKKHPKGTSGSVDHIAFLAKNAFEVRERIQSNNVEMHFRSFPDAKPPLFQIFLKDPDDVTVELNFLGEQISEDDWKGKGSASALSLKSRSGKTEIA